MDNYEFDLTEPTDNRYEDVETTSIEMNWLGLDVSRCCQVETKGDSECSHCGKEIYE